MKKMLVITLMMMSAGSLLAQSNKVFKNADGVALNGHDVVAYFEQHDAVHGLMKYEVEHKGAKYWFATEDHKNAFQADPAKYLPQYGGYCAFAMAAKNAAVPSDPKTFKLRDGKLYLFFNDYHEGAMFNTIVPWNEDEANMAKKADENWKAMNK